MLVENPVDFLLPLDSVQTVKTVADGGDQIFPVTTLYLDVTFRKLFGK